jgi:hypothetical protein
MNTHAKPKTHKSHPPKKVTQKYHVHKKVQAPSSQFS